MLSQTIPSYLYEDFSDDDDLQAFISSFNAMAQEYVAYLNTLSLPIYTSDTIVGALLDWVATGIYDIPRPSLPGGGTTNIVGPLNTYALNTLPLNVRKVTSTSSYYTTNDDIYKRIITWNFFKGDGMVFSIRWLKRRIMRFLTGVNGLDPGIDQTNQISITFGLSDQLNINIKSHASTLTRGALLNSFALNSRTLNDYQVTVNNLTPLPNANILAAAINAGVLHLPFQYQYAVNVT